MKTGKALLAVLAGVTAGAALGVLFAPERGFDTRKKISRKGDRLANTITNRLDEKFDEILDTVAGKQPRSKSEKRSDIGQTARAVD